MVIATQVLWASLIGVSSCGMIPSFTKLWSFDLLNITSTTTNPEIMTWHTEVVRLGRGRVGFSGFVDIRKDLDDFVVVSGSVERSLKKDGPFTRLPFAVESEKLTAAMNKYYKAFLMPVVDKCCVNAPSFKGKFVAPLTKRYVEINSCMLSSDDMPNIMMEGYYWVHVKLKREFELSVHVLSYVETVY